MEFARIRRDSSPITLPEWNALVASNSSFEPLPDRTVTNPFTGQKIAVVGAGKAYYVINGKRVGNASLEDGDILTTAIDVDVCQQIARVLNAAVFEDDRI